MNCLKRTYFTAMSGACSGIAHTIGFTYAPWTRKSMHYEDVINIREVVRPGDMILVRTMGELTTVAIPGFWKHLEVYVGDDMVVGAVSPKVRRTYLPNVVMRTDNVAIMRCRAFNEEKSHACADYAIGEIDKLYDFGLKIWDKDEAFCSEVCFHSVNYAMGCSYLELRYRMGYPTFTPDDCYNAVSKFECVYEKRS